MGKPQFIYLSIIAFTLSCFASASYALPANNGITITGTTSNSITRAPIQDVTVSTNVSGTSFKATTDNLGKYTLNITFNRKPALISLVASKKGYLPSVKILSNIQPNRSYTADFSLRDITPPSKPIVTDDGQYTNSTTSLHAKWSSEDAESGIKQYYYSIGTAPGTTDVVKWVSAGKNTEVTLTNLNLIDNVTYYFNVRAINGVGLISTIGSSDGIIVDLTAPSGTAVINNSAQYTNSTAVSLTLSATDAGSGLSQMQFSNDGTNWSTPESYATSKSWSLVSGDGTNTVYARFIDGAGNISTSATDTIILDTTAPVIAITSPANGFVSTAQTITVSGTINDNQAIVTVNDTPTTGSSGTFTANNIALTQGSNTITATATDLAGNNFSSSITVNYQPTVTFSIAIISPANNAYVTTSTITVSGTVTDSTATVTVNGNPVTVANNTFTALYVYLTQGTNIITATATKGTSSAQATINVILDTTPPSINIYTPDNNSTTRSNIVYGRVSDDTQTVTVNGTPATVIPAEAGIQARFIARPTLTEGANTITVQAQDRAGNTAQASVSITYNTTTPKVTITSPLNNSTQNISPINVQGTSASDLKYVIVGSLPARIDEGNFIVYGITLNSAYTVITAEGYDANDNLFEDSVFVTSPQLANYQFTDVSGNAYEYEDTRPIGGTTQILKVTLEKNSQLAPNEEIRFNIIEGNGNISQSYVFTDDNGNAQVILTTDTNVSIVNKVDCFVSNNPLVKTTFVIYTKPGAPSTLTKVSDDSIAPVPGTTVDLIVKLTDSSNNPIPNENINFQITQGTGTLSVTQAATTYYGETKVTLTASANPNETTQVTATSATNQNLSVTFNSTTSQATTLTFDDVMNKVNENGNRIQDFMADVVKISNEPGIPSEEGYKIWEKGSKTKIQLLYPEQRSYIIERTENSINLNGAPFLIIEEQGSATMTTTDSIESFSGDIFVLKRSSISPNFQQITKIYVDYSRGIITKVCSEYSSEVGKGKFEEERSYVLIDEIWVANSIIKKSESLIDNSVYTTTKNFSNIVLNSGIPDSVFQ